MLAATIQKDIVRHLTIMAGALGIFIISAPHLNKSDDQAFALTVVALISAFMVLPRIGPSHPAFRPLPLFVLASGALLSTGLTTGPDKLVPLSGILLVCGAVIELHKITLRQAIPFFVCLTLAVPAPAALETELGMLLADFESKTFVIIAQSVGLAVYQFETQIVLGEAAATINVDCSGTLLLWPAALGGVVAAFSTKANIWRLLKITTGAILLALGLNLVRLAILLFLNFHANEALTSAAHDTLGWFIMPLAWFLPILVWGNPMRLTLRLPHMGAKEAGVAVLVLGISMVMTLALPSGSPDLSRPNLPYYVEGWTGAPATISDEEERILGATYAERRLYQSPSGGRQLIMTLMQHETPRKANEHSSKACYEAIGWQVEELEVLLSNNGSEIRHLLVRSFDQRQAITEIILAPKEAEHMSAIRLQFVEDPRTPLNDRHEAALAFVQAFGLEMGDI